MNEERLQLAKKLASRSYQVHVFPDESTEGDPCFVATVPELPVCMSDGDTVEEAISNIESAKVDFIYFLLEDGLPVPEPQMLAPYTCVDMGDFSIVRDGSAQFSSVQFAG